MLLEKLTEKVRIIVSDHPRDLLDGNVGAFQKLTRRAQTKADEVSVGRYSHLLTKQLDIAGMAQVFGFGEIGDAQIGMISRVKDAQRVLKSSVLCACMDALCYGEQKALQGTGKRVLLQMCLILG